MEAFHYTSGQLACEEVSLASVAELFGTPAYVYSQAAVLDNFRSLERHLRAFPSLICYSVKANSNLKILRLLREAGAGFDVVSNGELARALKAGADPNRVVFSGVGKTAAEVDSAIQVGIRMFNVESAGELELIDQRARVLGRRAGISMRVNPDVAAETHPYTATGRVIHKFGVSREEALELYRLAAQSPHLVPRGIACHIGSQILEADPFLEALDEILSIAQELRGQDIRIEDVDLGGGYGIPYREEPGFDFERLTKEIERRLKSLPYHLILEPGRALVGNAGVLLTRVLYVKANREKSFIVVDGGMNDLLRPALYGAYHRIIPVEQRTPEETMRVDVVGPLCETGDFLAQDRELPSVCPGDLLAVMTVGAYGFVLASNYNSRPRPAEVLVNGAAVELIRPRERIEDLMASETP